MKFEFSVHKKHLYTLCMGVFFLLHFAASSLAQSDTLTLDTNAVKKPRTFKERWNMLPHSPMKATVFSAILPGAGQVYNKKYWKAPIAVVGEGVCIGFILYNTQEYLKYKNEFINMSLGKPSTLNKVLAAVNDDQEYYRKMRDISYLSLIAVHLLQVIDANVDAHLTYFDVGNDLSLNIHPSFVRANHTSLGLGLSLHF
jgi:hypothetical protein